MRSKPNPFGNDSSYQIMSTSEQGLTRPKLIWNNDSANPISSLSRPEHMSAKGGTESHAKGAREDDKKVSCNALILNVSLSLV
jgi:hypothetical protein